MFSVRGTDLSLQHINVVTPLVTGATVLHNNDAYFTEALNNTLGLSTTLAAKPLVPKKNKYK